MDIISEIHNYLKKRRKFIKNIIMLVLAFVLIGSIVSNMLYNSKLTAYEQQYAKNVEGLRAEIATLSSENDDLKTDNAKLSKELQESYALLETYETKVKNLEKEINDLNLKLSAKVIYPDEEYQLATAVWNHLKALGLNDYVCAGILGNIMAEVGGQTLDFSNWEHWSQDTHYGICQWGGTRKERLLSDFGKDFESQVRFLGVELFEVIPKNDSFYGMQDEKETALYFAKYYERCSSKYYEVRRENATKALQYFT